MNKEELEEIKKKNLLDENENPEDDDQNFIKKGDDNHENSTDKSDELVDEKDDIKEFLSKKNQQRNLDRETGGLEQQEQKESSEKDAWDDRSQEVDKMGSTDTFNTTGMKSVVWQAKKNRLKAKKHSKEAAQEGAQAGIAAGIGADLMGTRKMTMVEKIKALKQMRQEDAKGGGDLWR